jgi:hypothetical protein
LMFFVQLHIADQAFAANAALNEQGYAQASIGIRGRQPDHDSRSDLFLTISSAIQIPCI